MEKLPTGKCTATLELDLPSTTLKDIPDEYTELIMAKLDLVDHYKAWDCLMKSQSLGLGGRSFNKNWFLNGIQTICRTSPCARVDDSNDIRTSPEIDASDSDIRSFPEINDINTVRGYYCCLLFSEPILDKEQMLYLNLEDQTEIGKESELCLNYLGDETETVERFDVSPERFCGRLWFAADKGLLVFNLHQDVRKSKFDTNDKFVVLNPINNSMSTLPPIPAPLCRCKYDCGCIALPLKLTVKTEGEGGFKTTLSSSYKVYVMEGRLLPRHFRLHSEDASRNFRVIVYDSMTKLWAPTGAQWTGSSFHTQIFPTRDGILFISTRFGVRFHDSCHDFLHKFQDGNLVGKVKPPYKLKQEDRYCERFLWTWRNDTYSCGCISTTVFEAEGKIFFFQQKSWVCSIGPNCISAMIWELDDREMIWIKLPDLPPHRFEFYPMKPGHLILTDNMFKYEGVLVVVHGHLSSCDFYHIAGFDIFKKAWCKVPDIVLGNNRRWLTWIYNGGNPADLDNVVFEPNAGIRA